MITTPSIALLFLALLPATPDNVPAPEPPTARQSLIVVVGAAGEAEYGEQFSRWADRWQELAEANAIHVQRVGQSAESPSGDWEQLRSILAAQVKEHSEPLWIVLIGHGTFDGREARFNLRGPDMTAQQLQEWLAPFERPVVVVNCASASAPFMKVLAGSNRVIITATKSGYQYNFARLGDYLSQTIGDPQADLDKDGQTSLLEAYLLASSRTEEFYRQEARLATENALLDDNGDARGTPASWFRGVRAVQQAKDDVPVDGVRAHQLHLVRSHAEEQMPAELRAQRDALEQQLEQLRQTRSQQNEDAYYEQLLAILQQLALLYDSAADP